MKKRDGDGRANDQRKYPNPKRNASSLFLSDFLSPLSLISLFLSSSFFSSPQHSINPPLQPICQLYNSQWQKSNPPRMSTIPLPRPSTPTTTTKHTKQPNELTTTSTVTTQTNPRGIPVAPFVDNVNDYVSSRAEVERTLRSFQEMISKYQFMEVNSQRRGQGLRDKIPDIKKTLDMVRFMKTRKEVGRIAEDLILW